MLNYIITGNDSGGGDTPTGTYDATIKTVVVEEGKILEDGGEYPPRVKLQLVFDDGKHIHWDTIPLKETTLWRLSAVSKVLGLKTMPLNEFIEAITGKRVRITLKRKGKYVDVRYSRIPWPTKELNTQSEAEDDDNIPF